MPDRFDPENSDQRQIDQQLCRGWRVAYSGNEPSHERLPAATSRKWHDLSCDMRSAFWLLLIWMVHLRELRPSGWNGTWNSFSGHPATAREARLYVRGIPGGTDGASPYAPIQFRRYTDFGRRSDYRYARYALAHSLV